MASAQDVAERPDWDEDRAIALLERLITSERDGFFEAVTPGKYDKDARALIDEAGTRDPVALYQTYLEAETRLNGKTVPCEQTPRYLFFTREILAAFPQARVVNLVRDPRDVLLSQKNKWKRRKLGASNIPRREALRAWSNYHPAVISKLWASAVNAGLALRDEPRVLTLKFEDLVADPAARTQEICAHVGLTYEPEMIEVPQVGSSTGADRANEKGISANQAGSWTRGGINKAEVALCEMIAARPMKAFGYEMSGISKWHIVNVKDVIRIHAIDQNRLFQIFEKRRGNRTGHWINTSGVRFIVGRDRRRSCQSKRFQTKLSPVPPNWRHQWANSHCSIPSLGPIRSKTAVNPQIC